MRGARRHRYLGEGDAGRRRRIEAAIDELSEEHREVILLKEVQGCRYQEIADILDISMGTVMSRLFYARKKLQTLLEDIRP